MWLEWIKKYWGTLTNLCRFKLSIFVLNPLILNTPGRLQSMYVVLLSNKQRTVLILFIRCLVAREYKMLILYFKSEKLIVVYWEFKYSWFHRKGSFSVNSSIKTIYLFLVTQIAQGTIFRKSPVYSISLFCAFVAFEIHLKYVN